MTTPQVGPYTLVCLLGKGGFGEVWRARDESLGRDVALKLLALDDADDVKRFMREAQTAAALDHPNIAKVFDVGQRDGTHYIAMQLVDGASPRGPLPPLEAARIVRDAARAVQHAHERGIVHRDLKPANILVEPGPRVHVLDFGLARSTRAGASFTASGILLGTPAYMSPEQAKGRRAEPASDVWSLGATLYELLAGRPPFEGATIVDVLSRVLSEDPAPLPGAAGAVALRALEKDARARYASAGELADDLDRVVRSQPVASRRPARARRFVARHRVAAAVLAAALLVVGAAAWVVSRTENRLSRRQELEPLIAAVARARATFYIHGSHIRAELDAVERAVIALESHEPKDPEIHAMIGIGRHLLGDERRAERSLLEAGPHPLASYHLGRVYIERALAVLMQSRAGLEERHAVRARELCARAQACFDRCPEAVAGVEAVDLAVARAYRALAARDSREVVRLCEDGLRRFGEQPGTEEFHTLLAWCNPDPAARLAACDRALRIRPHFPLGLCMRGALRSTAGDREGALSDCDAAVRILPRFAQARCSRGLARHDLKDLDGALADYDEAIRLDPGMVAAWLNRATLRQQRGDPDGAIADATEAARLDPECDLAYVARGSARHAKEDYAAAIADFDRADALRPNFATGLCARGAARLAMGDVERALVDFDAAVSADGRYAIAYAKRANARQRLRDLRGAREDCDAALAIDPACAEALVTRSMLLVSAGEPARAIDDATEAIRLDPSSRRAYGARATARISLQDHRGAVEDLDVVIRLDPAALEPYMLRGLSRWNLGDAGAAAADFEHVLRNAPPDWPQRGAVEQLLGQLRGKR
jgi:tetratricopeptide (TPR) repeat protein